MGFKKGNPGGPGRPKRSVEEKYLKKIQTSITLTEWRDIVKRAIADAKKGDSKARQWLADYLVGKPKQGLEVDTIGEILFRVLREDS